MSRTKIKTLKKAIHAGSQAEASARASQDAREAALELLRHSVRMKHDRLAMIRLLDAIRLQADIDNAVWHYFERVASVQANPGQLRRLRKAHMSALAGAVAGAPQTSRSRMR